MHIAVHCVPPAWFIVQVVDCYPAVGRGAELANQVTDPVASPCGCDGNACRGRINAGNVATLRARTTVHSLRVNAISAAAVRIHFLLVWICRKWIATRGSVLCHPSIHRNRAERLRSNCSVARGLGVECARRFCASRSYLVFKVPVACRIGHIEKVVVARSSIASPSIDCDPCCLRDGRCERVCVHAIDVRTDGMSWTTGIHAQRRPSCGRRRIQSDSHSARYRWILHACRSHCYRRWRRIGRLVEATGVNIARTERTACRRAHRPRHRAGEGPISRDRRAKLQRRAYNCRCGIRRHCDRSDDWHNIICSHGGVLIDYHGTGCAAGGGAGRPGCELVAACCGRCIQCD